jgi:hypothetical protein
MIVGIIIAIIGVVGLIRPFWFMRTRYMSGAVLVLGLLVWFASGFH